MLAASLLKLVVVVILASTGELLTVQSKDSPADVCQLEAAQVLQDFTASIKAEQGLDVKVLTECMNQADYAKLQVLLQKMQKEEDGKPHPGQSDI